MKTFFLILLIGHGLIHFMGFARAFDLTDFQTPVLDVSRSAGLLWALTGTLLLLSAYLFVADRSAGWIVLLAGVLLSQWLIFGNWSETKFGTVANVLLLGAVIISWAIQAFAQENHRLAAAFPDHRVADVQPITEAALAAYPVPVQTWLRRAGVVGRMPIAQAKIEQQLELRMNPESERWLPAVAEQQFDALVPAFFWTVRVRGRGGIPILGRDALRYGKGSMKISLAGLFSVVDEHDNSKMDEATLQRYLVEMLWIPTAALHPDMHWEMLDERRVRVRLQQHGTEGSGIFHFDAAGDPAGFTAERYKGGGAEDERMPWRILIHRMGEFSGLRVPTALDAIWDLPEGEYHWLRLEVTAAHYADAVPRVAASEPVVVD